MTKQNSSRFPLLTAVLTATSLVAFAFNQHTTHAVTLHPSSFFLAAAIICLAPILYVSR